MTRTRPDWPTWWAIATLAVLAMPAALTADGQQTCPPPGLTPGCVTAHPLPCPYPSAVVTPAMQQAIIAQGGPWVLAPGILAPYPGMAREYPTAEDWRRAAWGLPSEVYRWPYCRLRRACGLSVENAAMVVFKTVKPNAAIDSCVGHTGDHSQARDAAAALYGAPPTLGQWLELECHNNRGGRWTVDGALRPALLCSQGGVVLDPEPEPQPDPVPPPPSCTPFEGSPCEARCDRVGRDRAWCLDPERESGAAHLFNLCSGVCRGGEPEPEPEEPVELECWEGEVRGRFVPGVPSTGQLEIEMFRVDCPEGSP